MSFLVYGALGALFLLLALHLQVVGGLTPSMAGTPVLPVTAMTVLFSSKAGALACG